VSDENGGPRKTRPKASGDRPDSPAEVRSTSDDRRRDFGRSAPTRTTRLVGSPAERQRAQQPADPAHPRLSVLGDLPNPPAPSPTRSSAGSSSTTTPTSASAPARSPAGSSFSTPTTREKHRPVSFRRRRQSAPATAGTTTCAPSIRSVRATSTGRAPRRRSLRRRARQPARIRPPLPVGARAGRNRARIARRDAFRTNARVCRDRGAHTFYLGATFYLGERRSGP